MCGFSGCIWLIVGLFFLVLFVVVLISPIKIQCQYLWHKNSNQMVIKVTACYGLIKYKKIIKHPNKQEQGEADEATAMIDNVRRLWKVMQGMTSQLSQLFSKLQFTQFRWHTTVGTGDAMWTALSCGSIFTLKSFVTAYLLNHIHFVDKPNVKVQPIYSHPIFATRWSCIAQIRFGKAIIAGLVLIAHMHKEKGAIKEWRNILSKA